MRHEIVLRPSQDGSQVLAFCPDLPGGSAAAPDALQALAMLHRRLEALGISPSATAPARDIHPKNPS